MSLSSNILKGEKDYKFYFDLLLSVDPNKAFVLLDVDYNIIIFNTVAKKHFESNSDKELKIGESIFDYYKDKYVLNNQLTIKEIFNISKNTNSKVLNNLCYDNYKDIFEISSIEITPVNRDGKLVGFSLTSVKNTVSENQKNIINGISNAKKSIFFIYSKRFNKFIYFNKNVEDLTNKTRYNFYKDENYWKKFISESHVVKINDSIKSRSDATIQIKINDKWYEGHIHSNVDEIIGLFIDIEKRKNAIDKLKVVMNELYFQKSALDNSAYVIVLDNRFNIKYSNDKFLDATGYEHEDLVGREYYNFLHKSHGKKIKAKFTESINEPLNIELKIRKKDKSYIFVNSHIIPFKDHNYNIDKYVAILFDVTDRVRYKKELELKNYELDKFSYSVAHDLRSPISTIMGLYNLSILEGGKNDTKYMELVNDSIIKLDNYVRNIAYHSEIQNDKVDISKINFSNIIDGIINSLNIDTSQFSINKKINLSGIFQSNEKIIKIVFENLISNAYRFRSNNRKSILDIIIDEDEEENVIIKFNDNGVGINLKLIDKIFNMFYRANENSNGAGLGLYVVKKSIEKIRGEIKVSSVEEKGTNIIIKIPNCF